MTEQWTLSKLLAWSETFLRERGSQSPRLDAELLLSEVLQLSKLALYTEFDRPVMRDELARYKALLIRRANHEPVAYILGNRGFHSIELKVRPGVLIPRPETEHLVDLVLHFLAEPDAPSGAVVDVGTGTGAIALAIAAGSDATRSIYATDISDIAVACAQDNVQTLRCAERVEVFKGDLLEPLRSHAPFAAIVSNPPYVRHDVMAKLPPTVRDHEPHLALDGGDAGMEVIEKLVNQCQGRLVSGGLFALELGDREQGDLLVDLLAAQGFESAKFQPVGPGPTGLVSARNPR